MNAGSDESGQSAGRPVSPQETDPFGKKDGRALRSAKRAAETVGPGFLSRAARSGELLQVVRNGVFPSRNRPRDREIRS